MPIFTAELPNVQTPLREMEAPLGEYLGAKGRQGWLDNPTSSIDRMQELSVANAGGYEPPSLNETLDIPVPRYDVDVATVPEKPKVKADDARKRVAELGLPLKIPDDGIHQEALDILIKRKQEENFLKSSIDRGPSGILPGMAGFGVSLGVSILDPINVASAFVPVVGPARYSAMLAGASGALGRAGVRAGVGALEGGVGAALVEPIVYSAKAQEQADYSLSDSLLNIAFGTALGGGLHVAAGAYGDFRSPEQWRRNPPRNMPEVVSAADPEVRQAALKTALAQLHSGKEVDIEAILRLDRRVDGLLSTSSLTRQGPDNLDAYLARRRQEAGFEAERQRAVPEYTGRELEPDLFRRADELDAKIEQARAQANELAARRQEAQTPSPEVQLGRERISQLEAQLAEFTGKRKSSPKAKALREEIANLKKADEDVWLRQNDRDAKRESILRQTIRDLQLQRAELGPEINAANRRAETELAMRRAEEDAVNPLPDLAQPEPMGMTLPPHMVAAMGKWIGPDAGTRFTDTPEMRAQDVADRKAQAGVKDVGPFMNKNVKNAKHGLSPDLKPGDLPPYYENINKMAHRLTLSLDLPRPIIWIADTKKGAGGWAFMDPTSSVKTGIVLSRTLTEQQAVAVLLHEIGHLVDYHYLRFASSEEKRAIEAAYKAWIKERGGKTKPAKVGEVTPLTTLYAGALEREKAGSARWLSYANSFPEWFAEQVSRFLSTKEKPVTLVDKFFSKISDLWKKLYEQFTGHVPLSKEVDEFLKGKWRDFQERPLTEPEQFAKFKERIDGATPEDVRMSKAVERVREQVRREQISQRYDRLADREASLQAEEIVKIAKEAADGDINALKQELDDVLADLQIQIKALNADETLAPMIERELAASAEVADGLESYAKAIEAAASCRLRKG